MLSLQLCISITPSQAKDTKSVRKERSGRSTLGLRRNEVGLVQMTCEDDIYYAVLLSLIFDHTILIYLQVHSVSFCY